MKIDTNNHIVYVHTLNDKVYIGQTYGDNEKEWNRRFQNGNGYKRSLYFYNAIQKYGWENVRTEILFTGLSQEEANLREELLIRMYDTTNHDVGYNITLGGCGNNQGKGSYTKEYRLIYIKKHRKVHGESSRQKLLRNIRNGIRNAKTPETKMKWMKELERVKSNPDIR